MKFISDLSKEELKALSSVMKSAPQHRMRQRAHAIMLSNKKYSIDTLSTIFNVHRDTVSRWLDVWDEKGLEGLNDAPKPGRPRKRSM